MTCDRSPGHKGGHVTYVKISLSGSLAIYKTWAVKYMTDTFLTSIREINRNTKNGLVLVRLSGIGFTN